MLTRSTRQYKLLILYLSSLTSILAAGSHRENLALRHPCYTVNKRLEPFITWTEKLASSQYKGELIELLVARFSLLTYG